MSIWISLQFHIFCGIIYLTWKGTKEESALNQNLWKLLDKAENNEELKQRLLQTKDTKDPYLSFCEMAEAEGYPISVGELFSMGQEYCDNLLKSVNGGATYPREGWDDAYESFFAALEGQKRN